MPSSINTYYASDHQSNAFHTFFYISRASDQEIVNENYTKYEIKMFDDGHYGFYDLWGNVSITAWHTSEIDSAHKNSYRSNNEVLFLKNAYMSLSGAIFQYFVLTIQAKHGILYGTYFTLAVKILVFLIERKYWSCMDIVHTRSACPFN